MMHQENYFQIIKWSINAIALSTFDTAAWMQYILQTIYVQTRWGTEKSTRMSKEHLLGEELQSGPLTLGQKLNQNWPWVMTQKAGNQPICSWPCRYFRHAVRLSVILRETNTQVSAFKRQPGWVWGTELPYPQPSHIQVLSLIGLLLQKNYLGKTFSPLFSKAFAKLILHSSTLVALFFHLIFF